MGFAARFDDEGERVLDAVRDRLGIDPGPRRVGRFALRRRLGAGAMGVVFLAEDPQLERAVALKLLRPGRDDAQSCARLRREAKALARLRHPNIVAVHELGVHEDQVFVAMEYVEGEDLREWLSSGSRSTADVLARFTDAGHGLAAAHAAGIVHRDFKPDNVLVGADGRTQVADFGLAAGRLDSSTTSDASGLGETGDNSLTRTGTVLGTPAYMAPEALRGAPATIASDQFSFCVSLYEGLFGARPFCGASIDALIDAVARGPRPRAPRGSQVPRHVWAALRRGLATNPADRWPDMRSLVDALCPRAKRRRRVAVMFLALALGSAGAVAWAWEPSCGQAGQRIRETWNEPRAAALRSALEDASLADGDANRPRGRGRLRPLRGRLG